MSKSEKKTRNRVKLAPDTIKLWTKNHKSFALPISSLRTSVNMRNESRVFDKDNFDYHCSDANIIIEKKFAHYGILIISQRILVNLHHVVDTHRFDLMDIMMQGSGIELVSEIHYKILEALRVKHNIKSWKGFIPYLPLPLLIVPAVILPILIAPLLIIPPKFKYSE